MRNLTQEEITILTNKGCIAEDWSTIQVKDEFSPQYISNAEFYGHVTLGVFQNEVEVAPGFSKHSGIHYATLRDVIVGDDCLIEHVGIINTTSDATFGQGTVISVLNEVGEGNVMIFDGLNSQMASLMVKYEHDKEFTQAVRQLIQNKIELSSKSVTTIGNGVRISHTTAIVNCHISDGCQIDGALRLQDCTLKSMPGAVVKVGVGVICENSVIYNGSSVLNNAKLENCFVGEACTITDGFTAESSLFFANCFMSNGEACAAFCGPFSASHHKSSLLISSCPPTSAHSASASAS